MKLIAFDLVGTLVSDKIFHDARSSIQVDFNAGWSEAEVAANFNNKFDYEAVFRSWFDRASVKGSFHQFRDFLVQRVTDYLYPDACEVLRALNSSDNKLGFVTDGSRDVEGQMIQSILTYCGIDSGNCLIVTGEDVGAGKKSGRPFLELVKRAMLMGIDKTNITFVGDNPDIDIEGAKGVGLRAILIRRLPVARAALDYEITSLQELKEL